MGAAAAAAQPLLLGGRPRTARRRGRHARHCGRRGVAPRRRGGRRALRGAIVGAASAHTALRAGAARVIGGALRAALSAAVVREAVAAGQAMLAAKPARAALSAAGVGPGVLPAIEALGDELLSTAATALVAAVWRGGTAGVSAAGVGAAEVGAARPLSAEARDAEARRRASVVAVTAAERRVSAAAAPVCTGAVSFADD